MMSRLLEVSRTHQYLIFFVFGNIFMYLQFTIMCFFWFSVTAANRNAVSYSPFCQILRSVHLERQQKKEHGGIFDSSSGLGYTYRL